MALKDVANLCTLCAEAKCTAAHLLQTFMLIQDQGMIKKSGTTNR